MVRKTGILVGIISFLILGCRDATPPAKEEKQELRIGYSNWSEGIAASYLAKNILETHFNYRVTPILSPIDSVYENLKTGEIDIFMDAWLPQTQGQFYKNSVTEVVDAGILFKNAKTGLIAPAGADIESIAELEYYTDTIFGLENAGITSDIEEALVAYGLNLSFLQQNEETMIRNLDSLYKRGEPVVISGWIPHPVFLKYDLKFLADPKGIFPRADAIHILLSQKAAENHPLLLKLFDRMELNQKQYQELILQVSSHPGGEDAGAREWMKQNGLLVEQWIRNLTAVEAKPM